MDNKSNSLKNSIFRVWNGKYIQCLEPREACTRRSIQAHSIQNGAILEMLQHDGHVVMPRLKLDLSSGPSVRFELVGRNKATTFTGLCADHDTSIFAPIETASIDVKNELHLFLLAYRAVLKETHITIEGAIKNQLAFQEKVRLGLIPGDRQTPDGLRATDFLVNCYETYLYKREFDQIYLGEDFHKLHHHTVFLKHTAPTIAANSLLASADNVQNPSETERIALNIFPEAQGTHVVFSYLSRQEPFVKAHLSDILNAAGHRRLYLISTFVLRNCENFVIAPKYFETIPDESRGAMLDYFQRTLYEDLLDHEDSRLFLFQQQTNE
jgi:hypothetical protein